MALSPLRSALAYIYLGRQKIRDARRRDGPPVRVVHMSDAQFAGFQDQMFLIVNETSLLHRMGAGVTDWNGAWKIVEHGPWDPRDCLLVLTRWLDAGLIEFHADFPDSDEDVPLSYAEASALLANPHWTDVPGDDEPYINVVAPRGDSRQYPEWLSLIPREAFASA